MNRIPPSNLAFTDEQAATDAGSQTHATAQIAWSANGPVEEANDRTVAGRLCAAVDASALEPRGFDIDASASANRGTLCVAARTQAPDSPFPDFAPLGRRDTASGYSQQVLSTDVEAEWTDRCSLVLIPGVDGEVPPYVRLRFCIEGVLHSQGEAQASATFQVVTRDARGCKASRIVQRTDARLTHDDWEQCTDLDGGGFRGTVSLDVPTDSLTSGQVALTYILSLNTTADVGSDAGAAAQGSVSARLISITFPAVNCPDLIGQIRGQSLRLESGINLLDPVLGDLISAESSQESDADADADAEFCQMAAQPTSPAPLLDALDLLRCLLRSKQFRTFGHG